MYERFQWTSVSKERNALTRRFEPVQPFFLFKLTSELPNAVVFDIGANIGVYAVLLGDVASVEKVHVFEPVDECVREIRRNVSLNGLDGKVAIHQVAVSDRSGSATFRKISDYSGGSGISDTHLFKDFAYEGEQQVPIETLDKLVDIQDRNIVLKIDVEGHEHKVLLGAERLLSTNRGVIQIEIHESAPDGPASREFLEKLGWTKLLRVGWDYYYSNLPEHQSADGRTAAIEGVMSHIVEHNLNAEQPSRRELMPGVTFELSRKRVDSIKKVLRKLPGRTR